LPHIRNAVCSTSPQRTAGRWAPTRRCPGSSPEGPPEPSLPCPAPPSAAQPPSTAPPAGCWRRTPERASFCCCCCRCCRYPLLPSTLPVAPLWPNSVLPQLWSCKQAYVACHCEKLRPCFTGWLVVIVGVTTALARVVFPMRRQVQECSMFHRPGHCTAKRSSICRRDVIRRILQTMCHVVFLYIV
jgi:hypothetical protein